MQMRAKTKVSIKCQTDKYIKYINYKYGSEQY